MRFKKKVPAENRTFLLEQLKQYKKEMTLTKEELKDLEGWVSEGGSPYENGDYICTEGGYPMDFISTKRFLEEEYEWHRSHPDEAEPEPGNMFDTESDDIAFIAANADLRLPQEVELPFN